MTMERTHAGSRSARSRAAIEPTAVVAERSKAAHEITYEYHKMWSDLCMEMASEDMQAGDRDSAGTWYDSMMNHFDATLSPAALRLANS